MISLVRPGGGGGGAVRVSNMCIQWWELCWAIVMLISVLYRGSNPHESMVSANVQYDVNSSMLF